ncbi:MAG TPA: hypothetical protein VE029_11680 [Rhizobacter sp.]|nr:hypothetical protein [Rhizobacter sp.]
MDMVADANTVGVTIAVFSAFARRGGSFSAGADGVGGLSAAFCFSFFSICDAPRWDSPPVVLAFLLLTA